MKRAGQLAEVAPSYVFLASELFALPADTKRRNSYGPDKPLYSYLAGILGLANAYESLAVSDRVDPERVRAFAVLG